jgi:hypothetical protein
LELKEIDRVERKNDAGWDKKPKRDSQTKSKGQYEREMQAWNTAQQNHKINENNIRKIIAWENYDKAIRLLESTPEGKAVLAELKRKDSGKVFEVAIANSHREMKVGGGIDGFTAFVGNENGNAVTAVLLDPSIISGSTTMLNGKTNIDSSAFGTVWHELHHAIDPSRVNADSLHLGTASPNDKSDPLRAHERRAVRFENIVRGRLGGGRLDTVYGAGTSRETAVPDPRGTGDYAKSLQLKQ